MAAHGANFSCNCSYVELWLSIPLPISFSQFEEKGNHISPPLVRFSVARWQGCAEETLLLGVSLGGGQKADSRAVFSWLPLEVPAARGDRSSRSSESGVPRGPF